MTLDQVNVKRRCSETALGSVGLERLFFLALQRTTLIVAAEDAFRRANAGSHEPKLFYSFPTHNHSAVCTDGNGVC